MKIENKIRPLVSIIVPVYNVEQYFARCIQSMIDQSYVDIEVLLVDDGSNDSSGDIADFYAKKDKRIISIHQKNAGVSVARNKGMDSASGEYITFVDPDDYLERDAIEIMVNTIIRENVDIVRTRCNAYRNDRKIKNDYGIEVGLFEGDKLKKLAYRSALHYGRDAVDSCCWLLLIKKNVVETNNIRFSKGIVIMQDTWFYVDLLRSANSLYSNDHITYNYMMNANGTVSSKSKFAEKIESIFQLYKYVASIWKDSERSKQLNTQYCLLIAVRTINSSNMNINEVRQLLKIISQYVKLFGNVDTSNLSFRHKLYVAAVYKNNPVFVCILAFIRRAAITVKG